METHAARHLERMFKGPVSSICHKIIKKQGKEERRKEKLFSSMTYSFTVTLRFLIQLEFILFMVMGRDLTLFFANG